MGCRTKQRVLNEHTKNVWDILKNVPLVIRDIQVKAALRFHLTPVRMTRICKTETFHPSKRVGWQEHSSIISGRENLYRHCKIRMAVPQKAGNRSPSRSRHNILWHIPKGLHPTIETLAHTFLTALFITAINWKQPRCPSTGDENVVHLRMGALFSCSKSKQLQKMTWNSQVNVWSWKK